MCCECVRYHKKCGDWGGCVDGIQTKGCEDLNACGTEEDKPVEERECLESCVENWNCTNWTFSTNFSISVGFGDGSGDGSYSCIQERNCTDINFCGIENNKVLEERECLGSNENFSEQFENCEPGNLTFYPFGDIIHYYQEVIGPEGNLCKIK